MKRLWQERRKAEGKSIHEPGPNIVMGANAQVALEKFARYFEVECRLVPVSVESKYRLDPQKAMQYVDENTIGVYVILGSTYTGHYEPVKEMSDLLDEYERKTGISIPIHGEASLYSVSFIFTDSPFSRRSFGCLRRALCAPKAALGLQASASCLYQHLRPQVWSGLRRCRLGGMALQGIPSEGPHL